MGSYLGLIGAKLESSLNAQGPMGCDSESFDLHCVLKDFHRHVWSMCVRFAPECKLGTLKMANSH